MHSLQARREEKNDLGKSFLSSLLRNNRRRYLIRDKSGNVRAACHRPSSLPSSLPRFHVRLAVASERAGGRHAWSVLRYLMMTSFLEASPARSLLPLQRRMQTFSDFSNVAEPRELCLPYMHEYFALIFTEMPPSDECLIAVAAAARGSLFADPLNGAAFEFARFPQICRLARPVTHSPCCVLPHPMTFAYSPTKDSL